MTPQSAADLLGVATDASADEVSRAFTRRARTSHPDRFAGAPPEQVARATEEFARLTVARDVLMRAAATRRGLPTETRTADGRRIFTEPPTVWVRRRRSWPVFGVWAGLMALSATMTALYGPHVLGEWDAVVRGLLLAAAGITAALTGRRQLILATMALLGLSAVITLFQVSFGSLFTLLLLIPPVFALIALARQEAQRRAHA